MSGSRHNKMVLTCRILALSFGPPQAMLQDSNRRVRTNECCHIGQEDKANVPRLLNDIAVLVDRKEVVCVATIVRHG